MRTQVLHQLVHREGLSGIYITFNHPYATLQRYLTQSAVQPQQLLVFDCITEPLQAQRVTGNCRYVSHLKKLLPLLDKHAEAHHRFVILDSLPLLEAYAGRLGARHFVRSLAKKSKKQQQFFLLGVAHEQAEPLISFAKKHCSNTLVW